MPQKIKLEKVEKLKKASETYDNFIFTNYRGLNVEQISTLRNNLRGKKAEFHVVKNRFAKRVFNEMGCKGVDQFLVDPTAIAYFNEDITEIAKLLFNVSKETDLEVKGGYSGGTIFTADELERISKLPSRDVMIAQTLGALNAPITGLVFVLGGVLSKFVRTLRAVEDKKRESEKN